MRANSDRTSAPSSLSRRGLLRAVGAGAAGASFAGLSAPALAAGSTPATPQAALDALVAGNKRYVAAKMTISGHELERRREATEGAQHPFAAVLSCADSRVPVELVFDQSIGQLFVVRVAGNVATPELIASLEYGAAVLGTKAILVLGHQNCGAVAATIAGRAVPGQISALYAPIRPAVDRAGPNLDATIRANAELRGRRASGRRGLRRRCRRSRSTRASDGSRVRAAPDRR
jgi:carbonic anhydrase